jgi:YidC/Oxa1 family membrane protein insertase
VSYIGVDAQFFSAVLIPAKDRTGDLWFAKSQAIRVGEVDQVWQKNVDTSCRLVSNSRPLKPGAVLEHDYTLFAGPKRPDLLEHYGLGNLVDYGWFHWIAVPMVRLLHAFYAVFRNWGVAIVLLTAVVRLCMFPVSRKQALGAQKMQELQPEIKKLQEKYKNNVEARTKAQQELFRKHNYNPLGGCLLVFLQFPIFVALYRALAVDVELRMAPLLTDAIRWASNLAAPDVLFDWSGFMPESVNSGSGLLGLGPYFNILPIITIVLFLWQQKKMMPPPTDEQSAMQQRVMKYMMVFMGILFYKVAAGLCVYFIASSLWGMGERNFLPKMAHAHERK